MSRTGFSLATCFNPRPRMRGDDFDHDCSLSLNGFNPRPRMRGDRAAKFQGLADPVSIHAPA